MCLSILVAANTVEIIGENWKECVKYIGELFYNIVFTCSDF
jgi:hypothetical protein